MTKAKKTSPAMSTAKYADRVGTSAQIVRRWIREGRLDGAVKKNGRGQYEIRPDLADPLIGHSESGPAQDGGKGDGRVSVKQFAHRIGVSVSAVRSAIERGRLDGAYSQNGQGHYRILENHARDLWNPKAAGSAPSSLPAGDPLDNRSGQEADADRKRFEARLAKLRWERETAQTVSVQTAQEETAVAAILLRDQLRQVGARVRSKLPRKITPKLVEALIDAEIEERLEALSRFEIKPEDEDEE